MATEFKHKITTPFAQNGTRTEIPQTSSDGSVSFDQGYTDLYSKKPSEGGKYVGRVPINYLFYLATAALKEIQEIIINGDIDALKKLQEDIQQGNIPVNMENARNILSVQNGGTGSASGGYNGSDVKKYLKKDSGTILELINALPSSISITFNYVEKKVITDLPVDMDVATIRIDKLNEYLNATTIWVNYPSPNNDTEYIGKFDGSLETGWRIKWLKTRNANGVVPFETGGSKTYPGPSGGSWVETKLENGQVLLEGFGLVILPDGKYTLNIPCRVNLKVITLTPARAKDSTEIISVGAQYDGETGLTFSAVNQNGFINNANVFWNFKGIKAQ